MSPYVDMVLGWGSVRFMFGRRLSAKLSARGAASSTAATLLRDVGHAFKVWDRVVNQHRASSQGWSGRPPGGAEAAPPLAGGSTSPPGAWIVDIQAAAASAGRG